MNIQIGSIVKFKPGLYGDEDGAVYKILEVNGDRVVIELVNTSMAIRPQSVARLTELEIAPETPTISSEE